MKRTARKLRKLSWRFSRAAWADNHGILLPLRHALISPRIAREIFLGDYEAKEIEIIRKRLTEDDVVFEVGAGIGFLSSYCAKRVGSEKVFAYEANPALLPLIQETYARNGVSPSLTHGMLGHGDGVREFYLDDEFWASSAHRQGGRSITVPQIDLNAELTRVRPSFLIVDIEGGEAEFFSLADLASVQKICLETHPGVLGDHTLSEMFARIFGQGFSLDFSLIRKNAFFFYRGRDERAA
ncbi:MAG: FkbM family methyltransferase [Rhodocyclaceae bacterium]|nr:FkbM family methyltransferase [Rhodocyclaceae bacterium]